ncbi:MICOS complex subunit MIC60-like isoform X1 [Sinocyclocheilus anshuiensis]|uniref:MICOS complex subunit MIC60 n=1 Tax=Sinocyclocheilus anshuiensis TaxID=1608454 RepID=A0A671SA12_9TELE|nr:PREDICTED: MICOS complex subunit MIC60-like isoform X1 [Sinocyclocheilus anshuiensis]
MLRVCWKGAHAAARQCVWGKVKAHPLQHCRRYTTAGDSGSNAGKIVAASLLTVGGGLGSTILYAKWDPKFRANIEKSVPYSDQLFEMALGPPPPPLVPLQKKPGKIEPLQISSLSEASKESKQPKAKAKKSDPAPVEAPPAVEEAPAPTPQTLEEASAEAAHIISAIGEVPSVPAPGTSDESPPGHTAAGEESKDHHEPALKERPAEEVSARLAQQDKVEQDALAALTAGLEESLGSSAKTTLQAIGAQEAVLTAIATHTNKLKEAMDSQTPPDEKSTQWKALNEALSDRTRAMEEAEEALLKAKGELEILRGVINSAKQSKIDAARPQILAAEENLHSMIVDLDKVVTKVQTAQTEAKIMSQYSELVNEAKAQFQQELANITPEIQANWKGLSGKLSADDLNSLIAHAHRRIDQLNRELAEQRVREQIHIEVALEQQKLEDQKALERAVASALEHRREDMRLEQEKKVQEVREVMEAEMRTQLRRQAAAHTDHLRDVLKVQEQELHEEAQEIMNSKMMEQETHYRRLTQEQLDTFTLDMNAAYARLKGIEEAIDSHVIAEEEARKAHQLWLSVEALNYTLKSAGADSPTEPLEGAVGVIKENCAENEFAQALASALPEESLSRGIYGEASLRARFYDIRRLARRVALIDETRNSLYQYFLSYLQSILLFEREQVAPPAKLAPEDLDTFRLLAYATYSIERGDLELAAKFVNQLRGASQRVAQDWLKEARLTLETKQVISLLLAYANAVGLGTTQAP